MFRDDSLLAFCQKPLNHCLRHPHEEKPLQEQPKRYLGFYHTTGYRPWAGTSAARRHYSNKKTKRNKPSIYDTSLATGPCTCPISMDIDDDQTSMMISEEERQKMRLVGGLWNGHNGLSTLPLHLRIRKSHWWNPWKSEEIHREFSDVNRGEKTQAVGKQSCLAKLDDTFVYMIFLFMWNWTCVMIWPPKPIHPFNLLDSCHQGAEAVLLVSIPMHKAHLGTAEVWFVGGFSGGPNFTQTWSVCTGLYSPWKMVGLEDDHLLFWGPGVKLWGVQYPFFLASG